MGFNSSTIGDKAEDIGTDQMALAASSLSADASEEEVRKSVAEIVAAMLEELPGIITWWISDDWAAKLVARVVDALGKTILDWLR
jgi:methylmalonyl-CoA mutase cobalamin-binding subunit